jgi:hypothetical protein
MISVGGACPETAVRANNVPQPEPSFAIPPVELMQPVTTLARVLIFASGTTVPAGTLVPGEVPVEVLTNTDASAKAVVSAAASPLAEPTLAGEVINGERADTAATVVTSLITIKVEAVSESQRPSAVIMARAELDVPEARPGFPPVATM